MHDNGRLKNITNIVRSSEFTLPQHIIISCSLCTTPGYYNLVSLVFGTIPSLHPSTFVVSLVFLGYLAVSISASLWSALPSFRFYLLLLASVRMHSDCTVVGLSVSVCLSMPKLIFSLFCCLAALSFLHPL